MDRRRFLELAAGSSPFIAGCTSQPGQETTTEPPTDIHTATSTFTVSPIGSATATETEEPTPTPRDNTNTIFVDSSNGSDGSKGTKDQPLATIQAAVEIAMPGETIYVKPGIYHKRVRTVRRGEPNNPITITGPPDAVYKAVPDGHGWGPFSLNHSHVHLTGLSFDGLVNEDHPEDASSYQGPLIWVNEKLVAEIDDAADPPNSVDQSDYLTGIKVKPASVANSHGSFIHAAYVTGIEIGEFQVTGLAGARYFKSDEPGHNGEVVYLGMPWAGTVHPPDRSNDVHIHHIDNSRGFDHAELVNTKYGTRDVSIEYCTDYGGWANTDEEVLEGSIGLQGG